MKKNKREKTVRKYIRQTWREERTSEQSQDEEMKVQERSSEEEKGERKRM